MSIKAMTGTEMKAELVSNFQQLPATDARE